MAMLRDEDGASGPIRWIERHEYLVLAALLLVALIGNLRQSAGKPLWYDELFTVGQTLQPTLHGMLQGAVFDGNPPTYALICKLLTHLFGYGDLVFRLPSLCAFFAAYLVIYFMLRRRVSAVAALAAVGFLCGWERFVWYATEARPYGFLFLFTAVTLAGWLLATEEGRHRRLGLVLVSAGIAGGVLSHHLGLVDTGLPLAAGVLTQTLQRRRVDWPLWLAAMLGAAAQCITLPLILRSRGGFAAQGGDLTSLHILARDHATMLVVPVCVAAVVLLAKKRFGAQRPFAMASPLVVASVACVATPLVIYILMLCTHNFYGGFRYGMGAYVCIGVLLGLMLERLQSEARLVLGAALLLPLLYWAVRPHRAHSIDGLALLQAAGLESEAAATEPVVIQDPGEYMQAWWYADAAMRGRLHFLELRSFGAPKNAEAMKTFHLSPYLPMPMEGYAAFLGAHPRFELLVTHEHGSGQPDYLQDELREDGYSFTEIAEGTVNYTRKITRTRVLYEVGR